MQTLAQTGVSKLAAKSYGREHDSSSLGGDSQWLAIRIAPFRRGDQLVSAQASSSMINQCVGRRTHAQIDCRCQIGFGINVAAGIGNWRSDHFR